MQVILNVDAESENLYTQVVEAAHQYLKDENRLANIRQYLDVLRHTEFVINEDITEVCCILNIDNYIYTRFYLHCSFLFDNTLYELCEHFICLILYTFRLFKKTL